MLKKLLIAGLSFVAISGMAQKNNNANVLDLKESITDSSIVYPESFEADTQKLLESWFVKNYTATDDRYLTQKDAEVSDQEIKARLQALPTVIEMPFNQIVRSYIDRYTSRSRAQVAAILGLSLYYMPIFEQALEARGLPLELKYLPVIESGLDPNAVSRHGATGLWQFMIGTAKGLGMEVSSLVDERRDPYVASERAASYLKDLHDAYGDWSLAIAAYNCGPGAVNKAIRRAGGDPSKHDFWSIYNYLSPETRGYVPMFIAANYVMTYYPQHNISPVLPTKPLVMDTIMVADRLHFNQISSVLDIPVEELRILNPQFRTDLIPGSAENQYTLILPSRQAQAYVMSQKEIMAFDADKYSRRAVAEPGEMPSDALIAEAEMEEAAHEQEELVQAPAAAKKATKTIVHKVVAGESLSSIADMYSVSMADIKRTNNLRRNAVRIGQQLRINVASDVADGSGQTVASAQTPAEQVSSPSSAAPARKNKNQPAPAAKKKTPAKASSSSHTLQRGESLSSLSKKYGVSIDEIKRANGMTSDKLRAGDKITIPAKSQGGVSTARKKNATSSSSRKSSSRKKRRR